jgi:NADPH-dependent glutamate synthase beta subunit-like oxidoreductase
MAVPDQAHPALNSYKDTTNLHGTLPERYPSSGFCVLIVGSGVAGLMAALECWRKGHQVQIIEKSSTRLTSGT